MTTEVEQQNATKPVAAAEKKAPEFDKAELLNIFDTIMFEGMYSETMKIKGRMEVTFRSLSAKDISNISSELDSKSINLVSTLQELRSLLYLYAGLTSYNGRDISALNKDQKEDFIGKLPAAIVSTISAAQFAFNRKVDAACQEGEENF